MASSLISISIAKSTPAMGLLKIAAIPPAAPHPRSSFLSLSPILRSSAVFDPIAAPVTEMGASNPAEPPNPNVKKLLKSWEYSL